MNMTMKDAYIVDGIRTPIGNFTGTLSTIRTDDLGAMVIAEVIKRNPTIPKLSLIHISEPTRPY